MFTKYSYIKYNNTKLIIYKKKSEKNCGEQLHKSDLTKIVYEYLKNNFCKTAYRS